MSVSLIGADGTNILTAANQLPVFTGNAATPANVGSVRLMCENDDGTATGTAYLKSPEVSQGIEVTG